MVIRKEKNVCGREKISEGARVKWHYSQPLPPFFSKSKLALQTAKLFKLLKYQFS